MTSHEPKGYAFGGLIKAVVKPAVAAAKPTAASRLKGAVRSALRATPPVPADRLVAAKIADMIRRQEDALALKIQHGGWKYADRRAKIWDKTGLWLDREKGGREVLKHEVSDAPATTRQGALETLKSERATERETRDLADWVNANPGGFEPLEIDKVNRTVAGLDLQPMLLNQNSTLDDTFHHPLLKAAYPDVWARTRTSLYDPSSASGMEGHLGEFHAPRGPSYPLAELRFFAPGGTRNSLTGGRPLGSLDSTMTHEMGHNLQDAFGWQNGAHPEIFEFNPVSGIRQSEAAQMDHYYRSKGEADARLAQWRQLLAQYRGDDALRKPPWEMYDAPGVEVDEADLILDTSPWENYLAQKYGNQP